MSGEGGPDGHHVPNLVDVVGSQGHDPVTTQPLHTVAPGVRGVAAPHQIVI